MKLQLLSKYTELCEKSRFKFLPQIKTYLETEVEKDSENNEIINMPYPGNARYNFENRIDDNEMQALSITYMSFVKNIHIIDLSYNKLTDKGI